MGNGLEKLQFESKIETTLKMIDFLKMYVTNHGHVVVKGTIWAAGLL